MTPSQKRPFMESFQEFGFLMQIKAFEFTESNMKEMKKKNKKKNEMTLVVFVDWHQREKPRPQKSGYFYGAFISIFSHESAFRLVFRPHTKPVNPLTETLAFATERERQLTMGKRGKD